MAYRAGDVVLRRKGPVMHKGVVLRDGRVLHNSPLRGEHISSMGEFAGGRRVYVQSPDEDARRDRLRRAERILRDPDHYHLFDNNCDHTVTKVTHGRAHSPQLGAWLMGAAAGAAALLLTRNLGVASAAAAAAARIGSKIDATSYVSSTRGSSAFRDRRRR